MAVLDVGRGAFGWARRIVTSTGPTGVAAASAVGVAVLAVAVGTAIFAGTRPDDRSAVPAIAGSPTDVPGLLGPGSGGLPVPTGTPSPGASSPGDSASPSATGGTASGEPGGTPGPGGNGPGGATGPGGGGRPGDTPAPTPAPTGPVRTPPVPVPTLPPLPSPTFRPLLVLKIRAAVLGPLVPGRGGIIAVTVTVGAPALGIPERTVPLLGTGVLRLGAALPPGVRLAGDAAGDGWTCTGTTCHRTSLGIGGGSTALLPLRIARDARGDLTFTVSAAGAVTASVTLVDPILPGLTPIARSVPTGAAIGPLGGTPCDAAPWAPTRCPTLRTDGRAR
jgi:hypothetical protein